MGTVTIPDWSALGLLPPIDSASPTSIERSPYVVSLKDLVLRFATSPERKAILLGFLQYRALLHRFGATDGFQWLDGSFMEEVEMLEQRPPNDLDVVSFISGALPEESDAYLEHGAAKTAFKVDSYFVELDQLPPRELTYLSTYWYSMWSHRRNQTWKGFLQVELAPDEDAEALAWLTRPDTGGHSDSI